MMRLLLKFIFGLWCLLCLQGLAWAGPCEEVVFSNPTDFAKAMTEGLSLRGGTRVADPARHNEGQESLFELYNQYAYPYPHKSEGRSLNDVFRILEDYPELLISKPLLREQILEFSLKERDNPQSLKSFVHSLTRSAGQIRNNLFQIEANLGFWIKMLNFSSTDISRTDISRTDTSRVDISSLKKREAEQPNHQGGTENNTALLNKEAIGPHSSSLSKQEKKALKQKQNQKQKKDFVVYLNTTALNKEARDFIKDTSQPYRERAIVLYKALEEIHNSLSLAQKSQPADTPFVPSGRAGSAPRVPSANTAVIFTNQPAFPSSAQSHNRQNTGTPFVPAGQTLPASHSAVGQAMAELVHTVGFGNTALWVASLKSKDPTQSYEALRKILNERDILAVDLGFEGHFAEMTKKFNAKIEDTDPQLKQIEKDIQNQPYTIKGTEVLRLRALSLQESPFRSCMGGDCATGSYFAKALDPNFVYFTFTNNKHESSGVVTVVLGYALNQNGQKVKVAFVDKIQNVPIDRITAMLEGIRLSLKEQDYILGLPKEIGGHNDLANESLIRSYVAEEILPPLQNSLNAFTPHKHKYPFASAYSRADQKLDLWEFEGISSKDMEIKAGEIHLPKIASSSLTVRSLYEPILSLKDSRREEDQIKFLDNLVTMSQIKELGLSQAYVREHLDFVLKDKGFSFKVRKKAFYTLIEFKMKTGGTGRRNFNFLIKETVSFSAEERTVLIGEMSNWKNTSGYRRDFIDILSFQENWNQINLILESPWGRILNKSLILRQAIKQNEPEIVRLLLEKGGDVNARDSYGNTALIFASIDGRLEIIRLLLAKGADVNARNDYGITALMLASKAGHKEVVQLLLEKGADPNIQNKDGDTALILALGNDLKEIAQLLLEKGADPNIQNNVGNTALIWASGTGRGRPNIVSLLLEKGADPNIQNNQGIMALWVAIKYSDIEIVQLLLEKGADPNIPDNLGNTALILASIKGNIEIVRLLLKKEADVNARNKDGETASMIAEQKGWTEIVQLLSNANSSATQNKWLQIFDSSQRTLITFFKNLRERISPSN